MPCEALQKKCSTLNIFLSSSLCSVLSDVRRRKASLSLLVNDLLEFQCGFGGIMGRNSTGYQGNSDIDPVRVCPAYTVADSAVNQRKARERRALLPERRAACG